MPALRDIFTQVAAGAKSGLKDTVMRAATPVAIAKTVPAAAPAQVGHLLGQLAPAAGAAALAGGAGYLAGRSGKNKEAGMVVYYGLDHTPEHVMTNNEWLASIFKRDGSFKIPESLSHVPALGKYAGFLGEALEKTKQVLTSPIPGTPELFHSAAEKATQFGQVKKAPGDAFKKFQDIYRAKHAGFTVSQYSGPLNPNIESGASGVPPFRAPRLDRAIQKNSGAITPVVGPDRGDLTKAGASAPTRGNFMMASDLPAFRVPELSSSLQKRGGPESPSTQAADNTRPLSSDKYAMSLAQRREFVRELLKEASISSPQGQLQKSQSVGAPKASAPPGPSIAQIAKPTGAKWGTGIPGAKKTGIGGWNQAV